MSFPQASYPKLSNMRAYALGRLVSRPGSVLIGQAAPQAHSVRRLNDSVPGAPLSFTRVVGASTSLYVGQISLTQVDTGYSGGPLSLIPYRPDQSPEPLMYVVDASRSGKVNVAGTVRQMGSPPPLPAPITELAVPAINQINPNNPVAGWVGMGTFVNFGQATRTSTTISQILYDSGTTGWACIVPAVYGSNLTAFSLINVNSAGGTAELVEIRESNPPVTTTTIAAIIYDNLTGPGLCCIQMSASNTNITGLQRNAIITIGSETVRVLSATSGPGNQWSFRCSTVSVHAVGEAIVGLASFRCYLANTHLAGETLTSQLINCQVNPGIGWFQLAVNLDLSTIQGQPLSADDYFHIGILCDHPENILEGRLYFDVDSQVNDLQHNAYYIPFRQSDLQVAATGNATTVQALQQGLQNQQIDTGTGPPTPPVHPQTGSHFPHSAPTSPTVNVGSPSLQVVPGQNIWSELLLPVGLMQRIGSDESRTLANVKLIAVWFNIQTSKITGGFADITSRGGYGPDVAEIGVPILYIYRGRSSLTGTASNPSPATRYGLSPRRDAVKVALTQHPDPQIDKLDVFRFGGALAAELPDGTAFWAYVGTTPNGSNPTFTDVYADSDIANSPSAEFDNFQPWPDIDITHSGFCNIAGTSVQRVSGDPFNTLWAQGSEIMIGSGNGQQLYHLHAQPASANFLELEESFSFSTAASTLQTLAGNMAGSTVTQTHRQNDWVNPQNAVSSSGMYATVTVFGSNANVNKSSLLNIQNLGFNVPLTATITGVRVTIQHLQSSGTSAVLDDNVFLLVAGAPTGTNQNNAAPWTFGTPETFVYGGSNNLWGAGGVTPAVVNNSNFGIQFGLECTQLPGNGAVAGITRVTVEVFFTTAGPNGQPFFLQEATLLNQRLPVAWGPWNGMFFGCGSPYQPGYLFGTKGNNPDAAPDKYQWEVSSPSEPTVAGIMAGPLSYVQTTERLFQIIPSQDPERVIELQEVLGGGGLWSRWGICYSQDIGIAKIERDGIYVTTGGAHQSITAPELSLLFPHDGQPGQQVTLGSQTFFPPDFTQLMRLSCGSNHLFFDYTDTGGVKRTIVYSTLFRVWMVDTMPFGAVYHYMEEGLGLNSVLICGADGGLYQATGPTDGAGLIASEIRMPYTGSWEGFVHVRDGYLGLIAAAPGTWTVNGDGTDFSVPIQATAGYQKLYTALPPVKARTLEFVYGSTQPFEIYVPDVSVEIKIWGADGPYQRYNPFAGFAGV